MAGMESATEAAMGMGLAKFLKESLA